MIGQHKKLLSEYIEHEKRRGMSKNWQNSIKYDTPKLLHYLDQEDIQLQEVNVYHAGNFQKDLQESGFIANTVVSIIKVCSCFYNYLEDIHIVYSNPFRYVRKVRAEKKLPGNMLKEDKISELLNELTKFNESTVREAGRRMYRLHVIAEIMYSTGMRVSEVANLKVDDVDTDAGTVMIIDGKGGKDRICFLNEYTKQVVGIYIKKMRPYVITNKSRYTDNLFGYCKDSVLKYLNKVLKTACQKLKLGRFTSHSFRHCFGYHFLRRGCDIRHIQSLLGHECLRTTQIYTRIDKQDLSKMFSRYHPRTLKKKEPDI